MSLNYRDTRIKCELFRLIDPTLADDPCAHPDPEVEVVEIFKVSSFEEAAEHVKEYSNTHPGYKWYFRVKHSHSDYGLWHEDGVCSFGLNDVDEWFVARIVKYRKRFKNLKQEYPKQLNQENILKRIRYTSIRKEILTKVARLRWLSTVRFVRGFLQAWISTCDWCSWYLKRKWVDKWTDWKWNRKKKAYWKKNHHDITEFWSLDLHLLKDLKWNLKRLNEECHSINTEFIKDVVIEDHKDDPGFDLDAFMEKFYTGTYFEDVEKRAVKRQTETYDRICHLVDLYTFYLNQEIDDEDVFTSTKRTSDMVPILLPGSYDMIDYKTMFDKGNACWNEIWGLVKKYGQQMGD